MKSDYFPSQRAAIAVRMLGPLKEEAKKRQATSTGGAHPQLSTDLYEAASSKGRAIDQASRIVGVGATTIASAKAVSERDPDPTKMRRH